MQKNVAISELVNLVSINRRQVGKKMRKLCSSPTRRQISMKLVSSLLSHPSRQYKFVDELLADLLESAWLTLIVYFSLFTVFFVCIRSNALVDPSQSLKCSNVGTKSEALIDLTKTIESILTRLGLDRTSFVCYSTLYDLLRLGRKSPTSKRFASNFVDSIRFLYQILKIFTTTKRKVQFLTFKNNQSINFFHKYIFHKYIFHFFDYS